VFEPALTFVTKVWLLALLKDNADLRSAIVFDEKFKEASCVPNQYPFIKSSIRNCEFVTPVKQYIMSLTKLRLFPLKILREEAVQI
jgi:hypothetical protein